MNPKPTTRQPSRTGVLIRMAGVGLAILGASCLVCAGQSKVHLLSGETHECRVREYVNGAFIIELPNGMRATVRQESIIRIEFAASDVPSGLPEEFGLGGEAVPPPPVVPPGSEVLTTNATRLVLASQWQSRLGRGNLSLGDTARLLSRCGTPQIDLVGKNIALWGDLPYLMPVREAKKALGLGISTRSSMTCPAFPPDSFFFHEFSGNFEDGFNRLYLITDYADQVVGLQWQDNTSKGERWFPHPDSYSADWNLYNFVNNRRKANANWLVGGYVCRGRQTILGHPPRGGQDAAGETGVNEGVIRVDSELFSVTRDQWNYLADDKSKERVRLLLAQPVVDLMLYVAQQAR